MRENKQQTTVKQLHFSVNSIADLRMGETFETSPVTNHVARNVSEAQGENEYRKRQKTGSIYSR